MQVFAKVFTTRFMKDAAHAMMCVLLSLAMVLAFTPAVAVADEEASADIVISSAEDLVAFASLINEGETYEGMKVVLSANINLNGESFTPIGTEDSPFCGTFDGGSYTISGLSVTGTDDEPNVALFGYVEDATIQNLVVEGTVAATGEMEGNAAGIVAVAAGDVTLTNVTSRVTVSTGAWICYAAGLVALADDSEGSVTLIGCTNEGAISCACPEDSFLVMFYAGGLVGSATCALVIDSCVNSGSITGALSWSDISEDEAIGGLVGEVYSNALFAAGNVQLSSSVNTGAVTGLYNAAGLIGFCNTLDTTTIEGSENYGSISSAGNAGGLFAEVHSELSLTECANYGDVNSTETNAGGLVACDDASISIVRCANLGSISVGEGDYAGGIIAYEDGDEVTLNDCYNGGAVTSANVAGGFVGALDSTENLSLSCGYNSGSVSGNTCAGALVGDAGVANVSASAFYYVEGCAVATVGSAGDSLGATVLSNAELSASTFVAVLNGEDGTAWDRDRNETLLNLGYPVLSWQNPEGVYLVGVDLAGGTLAEGDSIPERYSAADGVITLPTPVRTGYEFTGWVDGGGASVTTLEADVTGDIELSATWKLCEYTVSVDFAGGTLAEGESIPESYTVLDEAIELPTPTRTGYTFTGWVDASGAEVSSIAGGSVGNVELTAVWGVVLYTVSVDLAGGSLAADDAIPATYTINDELIELPTPTRAGYTFTGWVDASGAEVSSIAGGSVGNVELTAEWEIITYTIELDAAGGSLSADDLTYTVETGYVLPQPSKEGYTFTGWVDEDGNVVSEIAPGEVGNKQLSATWVVRVTRLGGSSRYATMALVSQAAFADGECSTVIVCRGNNFPDALAAASLAGVTGGQVLLTATGSLSSQTKSEIERLGASVVYIIGDANSVSSAAEKSIKAISGVTSVTRLAGSNRYNTAIEIYKEGSTIESGWGKTCIVATGVKAADSLSVSSVAYAEKAPIFLADKSGSLSSAALSAIQNGGFTTVLVLGDTNSVSAATAATLDGYGLTVERLQGSNRYATSIAIAEYAIEKLGFSCAKVAVTAGNEGKYADALVASALCGNAMSPMLLVKSTASSSAEVSSMLSSHTSEVLTVYVLGDESSVSANLFTSVEVAVD